ncbi:hypothetical protein [Streptomyces sp. NPDC058255]|uniref:hypothetical protein n=1 Tax=Streptomyces sp. NPDC058255 TaxID=3346407 RepID=UPI0036F11C32
MNARHATELLRALLVLTNSEITAGKRSRVTITTADQPLTSPITPDRTQAAPSHLRNQDENLNVSSSAEEVQPYPIRLVNWFMSK